MNIPDKAVEAGEWAVTNCVIAADEKAYQGSQDITQEELRRVYLEAASPFIAAQALRDHKAWLLEKFETYQDLSVRELIEDLESRADELYPP